jgi:adenylate cyclase
LALYLTSDLVSDFQHSKALRVIDQNLLTRFEDGNDSVQHVGQVLPFDKLLRGTAGQSGSNIRVRAELIDAATGDAVWFRQFVRDATNSAEIENQIASSIAADVENTLRTDYRPQP